MDEQPRVNCREVEERLWRYVDRELPVGELTAVSEHIDDCSECRQLYHEQARDANRCRRALAESALGPAASDRILGALEGAGVIGTTASRVSGRRVRARWAIAALVPLAVGVLAWMFSGDPPRRRPPLGLAESADGVVCERVDGSLVDLSRPLEVRAGDLYSVPEGVELRVRLESSAGDENALVAVHGPAEFELETASAPDRFFAILHSGVVDSTVRPRVRGEPFEIRTNLALARVVGTRFTLATFTEAETTLEVSSGQVEFIPLGDGTEGRVERVTRESGPRVFRQRVASAVADSPGAVARTDGGGGDRSEATASDSAAVGAPEPGEASLDSVGAGAFDAGARGGASGTRPLLDQPVDPRLDSDE